MVARSAREGAPKFNRNGPPRRQFDTPHCIVGTNDGLLYVCNRGNQRIQIFKTDGTFVKEALIGAKTSDGTVAGAPWKTQPYAGVAVE
jgi:hypothetical protein